MRIGFTGAQGTGKTTLALDLAAEGGWGYIPSPARSLNIPANRDASILSQMMISLAVCLNSEREPDSNTVLDRTPLDSLAYFDYQHKYVWNERVPGVVDHSHYYFISEAIKNFDIIYYFPVYWKPAGDGFRDTSEKYQKAIDTLIRQRLDEVPCSVETVPNLPRGERLSWLKENINANLHV